MENKERTKVLKQIMAWVLTLVIALSIITIPETTAEAATGKVKSISVTNLPAKTLTIKKGKTFTLKTKVTVSGKASKAVTYKSSKKSVATVDSKGKIKAKKNGKTTITITSKANKKKKVKITVTVGTPVKKVKLEDKSGTVIKGKTISLLSKVTPAKASNKKLIWKSSNKKVATVSSKGVVKGVKAGTATITATAADGSGKKATYKVKVVNSISIKSVKVVNSYSVQVTLSDAYKLTASDFSVLTKQYSQGTYKKKCTVDSISTKDNKTYTLTLNQDSGIVENHYVKVQIQKCNSNKEANFSEGKYKYTSDNVRYMEKDSIYSSYYYYSGFGYSSATVSGLPSGMKYKDVSGSYLRFYGTPTKTGVYTVTIKSTDELGNTYTRTEKWIVYDDTHIYAASTPAYVLIGNGSNASISKTVTVKGGSNSYSYALTGNNYGLSIDSYGTISGEIPMAGTYKVNVKVTDTQVTSRTATTTVVINVKQGKTISGIVTDSDGNGIPYASVTLTNKDKSDRYSPSVSDDTDSKGAYSILVNPGTYDIEANYNDCLKYIYSEKITDTKSGYDIKMPMYKVYVSSNNTAINFNNYAYWIDEAGDSYGSGDTLYLKNGKYKLTTSYTSGGMSYTATLNVTVLNKGVWQTASVKTYNQTVSTGTKSINMKNGETQYFTFKAPSSGTYSFNLAATSSSSSVTGSYRIYLYDNNNDEIDESYAYKSSYSTSSSASITYDLIAGQTYYIRVTGPSYSDGFPMSLTISKTS
jgi:uncharacterized protein YjdB